VVNPVCYKKKRSLNNDNIRGNALNFSFLIPLKEKEKSAKEREK